MERRRAHLLATRRHRDAVLVSVLAYAGLPAGRGARLNVGTRARAHAADRAGPSRGEIKSTKTNQRRTVRLLAPLAADLAEWRLACGRPDAEALVFPAHDGGPWGDDDWGNWRNRVFGPAARAAAFEGSRPYDLRHSFCSLLIHEGRSIIEVARQLGHSPTMALNTYGHVFDEFEGGERVSAEARIRRPATS